MSEYPPAVAELLKLGEINPTEEWLDYPSRGLGPEHVPDLIRLVATFGREDDFESPASWGPVHAWRALGQLRVAEAAETLLQVVRDDRDRGGDWASEEMPEVFGLIGPPALPVLAAALRDPAEELYVRWGAADAIQKVAEHHPEARPECVALLAGQLENAAANDPTLNGALVGTLLDMKAVETDAVLQRAFGTGNVDESIAGGLEDARYELGLGPKPARLAGFGSPWGVASAGPRSPSPRARAKERAQKKRKQAKLSRKKNRKKK